MRESEIAASRKSKQRDHGICIGDHEVIIWNVSKGGSLITSTEGTKGRVRVATINANLFAREKGENVPMKTNTHSDVVLRGSNETIMAAKRVDLTITGSSILAKHCLPSKIDYDGIIKRGDKAAIVKP